MPGRKTPRWEADLWSYVSTGDGEHCPLYCRCQVRKGGGWCADENKERLSQLLDDGQFSIDDCALIEAECPRIGRVFQLVEILAWKYLRRGEVRCPPVPTALILLVVPLSATEVRLLPLKTYHGAIWHAQNEWIIQLKSDDSSAVKRLTLFHEAFHILAHCSTTPVFRKRGAIQGSFNELLADYFATCILMPRKWVEEKWAEVKDPDRMAEIFGVPKSVMGIRLKFLGLIQQF